MDDYYSPNRDILLQCPPILRENINQIWLNSKMGMSPMNVKITPVENRMYQEDQRTNYKDYFKLDICYAGKYLTWEILFNNEDYEFAPDFIFEGQTFLNDPDVDVIEKHLPSLANWNVKDSQSLTNVIVELLTLFREHQVKYLKDDKFAKIYAEYENLLATDFDENEIEIFVDQISHTVHFLFKMTVNYTNLPPYMQEDNIEDINEKMNPGEAKAILQTTFIKPDGTKVQTKLQLSPLLEQIIGNSAILHIPSYNRNSSLADYVIGIKKLLEERVEQITSQFKLKNEYISALLALHQFNVLEYDNRLYNSAVLLFEHEKFYALVYISIGNQFPREKPKVLLRSICKIVYSKPQILEIDDYPYSPRWDAEEMLNRLTARLRESLPSFAAAHNK